MLAKQTGKSFFGGNPCRRPQEEILFLWNLIPKYTSKKEESFFGSSFFLSFFLSFIRSTFFLSERKREMLEDLKTWAGRRRRRTRPQQRGPTSSR